MICNKRSSIKEVSASIVVLGTIPGFSMFFHCPNCFFLFNKNVRYKVSFNNYLLAFLCFKDVLKQFFYFKEILEHKIADNKEIIITGGLLI